MAHDKFCYNVPSTLGWHWELNEGMGKANFMEYLWLDAVSTSGHYIQIGAYLSYCPGTYGITEGGTPLFQFIVVDPDGNQYYDTRVGKYGDVTETEFGGIWGDLGKIDGHITEDGQVIDYDASVHFGGVDLDMHCVCEGSRRGAQFVDSEFGYSYYHPVKKIAMGWWPLAPYAKFTGTLTINGKTEQIEGVSYVDKQLSNKPNTFGSGGQANWSWGHIIAGDYTVAFTDSAADAKYKYRHHSPYLVWKKGELIYASFDSTVFVEQWDIHEETNRFRPAVFTMKSKDGASEINAQLTDGIMLLEKGSHNEGQDNEEFLNLIYARQLLNTNFEITRFGGFDEEVQGKCIMEWGAGAHFMPADRINANMGMGGGDDSVYG